MKVLTKTKHTFFDLDFEWLFCTIRVILTDSVPELYSELTSQVERLKDSSSDEQSRFATGYFIYDSSNFGHYYIILSNKADPDDVVHESVHAVTKMFDDKNIDYSSKDDESFAYMTAFIVKKILHKLADINAPQT